MFYITQEDVKFSIDMMNAKLTDEDKIQCNKVIKSYLDGKVADPVSEGKTIQLISMIFTVIVTGNLCACSEVEENPIYNN